MNELLQQLMQLGPGIGAGLSGNGPAMQAFMDGYMKTQQMLQQQGRLKQQDQFAQEDRTREIERQTQADARVTEDRGRRQALEELQLPSILAEHASTAETPQDAQALIESQMPNLMQVFGQETMAAGMPAVDMATRTITGRQKKQVQDYIESALKTSHIADNPDADPEIQLPEHLTRILGKPSAKLSELQSFAQLPVGKPAGKTRTPAAVGSFEDYVQRMYGDNATPEQILAARKAYNQSDDKPTVNVTLPGGISSKAGDAALKFQDDYARDSKPYLTMREAYQRVRSAKPDAAGDLSLIFAYMKILDPNSVVREQEFANAQNAAGVPDRVRNLYNQVMQGTRLNPEQRRQFQTQAEALFEGAKTNQRQVRGTYGTRAKQWGIPESMILDEEDEFLRATGQQPPPAAATSGPQVGERRKSPNGDLIEWDGKGWKIVRM